METLFQNVVTGYSDALFLDALDKTIIKENSAFLFGSVEECDRKIWLKIRLEKCIFHFESYYANKRIHISAINEIFLKPNNPNEKVNEFNLFHYSEDFRESTTREFIRINNSVI